MELTCTACSAGSHPWTKSNTNATRLNFASTSPSTVGKQLGPRSSNCDNTLKAEAVKKKATIMYSPVQYSLVHVQSVNSVLNSGSKPCALHVKCNRSSWAWLDLPFRVSNTEVGPHPFTLDLQGTQWPRSAAHAGMVHMYKAQKNWRQKWGNPGCPVPTALFWQPCLRKVSGTDKLHWAIEYSKEM